ncbi:MAG: hypothetical protein L6Q57_05190 [Alphaproteobacteria bacterium]|nr:hypothetical protein [Alphaproteobacteria bacterium]
MAVLDTPNPVVSQMSEAARVHKRTLNVILPGAPKTASNAICVHAYIEKGPDGQYQVASFTLD